MPITLKRSDGLVHIEQLDNGRNRISVELSNQELFMPVSTWETSYPLDLVEQIMHVQGVAYLCDQIMREEDPRYVQRSLTYNILSYISEKNLNNSTILDFGCGCGASTIILSRMAPNSKIIGVELEHQFVSVAQHRAKYYGLDHVKFLVSPDGKSLPNGLGDFDYVILSGVYQCMLPHERVTLLPILWSHIKPGGILFLNQTAHRYFPVERCTTLPLINYLPDQSTYFVARKFSKMVRAHHSWEDLLRMGIRGATVKEILKILNKMPQQPILLEPTKMGIKDPIDLWYKLSASARLAPVKKFLLIFIRSFKFITGLTLIPELSLAIKKEQ